MHKKLNIIINCTLGYAQINPQPLETSSFNNRLTRGSNALYHCAIKTSINSTGIIQWVNSSRHPLPALNTTCPASDLYCVCLNRYGVYGLHHPQQYTLDDIGRVKILNVSLVVCNVTVQLSGYYVCTHTSAMNVTMLNLTVTVPPPADLSSVDLLDVIISVAVGITLILILGAMMLCTVMCVRMCYGREKVSTALQQINVIDITFRKDMTLLDLSDSMQFPAVLNFKRWGILIK